MTLTVDASGVLSETAEGRAELSWTNFRYASVTRDNLFLKLRSGSVVLIPLRSFESPEAQANFVGIIAEHLRVKGKRALDLTPVPPAGGPPQPDLPNA